MVRKRYRLYLPPLLTKEMCRGSDIRPAPRHS
jgi:hypothetical protein